VDLHSILNDKKQSTVFNKKKSQWADLLGGQLGLLEGIPSPRRSIRARSVGAKETAFLLPDGPCRSEPDNEMNTLAAEIIKG
jgi:hypothetical protein